MGNEEMLQMYKEKIAQLEEREEYFRTLNERTVCVLEKAEEVLERHGFYDEYAEEVEMMDEDY